LPTRPEWLSTDIWPWPIASVGVDRGHVALSEIGRGPTLLFYTGTGMFVWRDLLVELQREFHCVAMDPPGIGASGPIAPADATLDRSARAVSTAITALDLSAVTLVVHDSGGPPAFAAAARLPQRIRGIVAVNTFGWRPVGAAFRSMLTVMGSAMTRRLSLTTGALARLSATSFGAGRHLDANSRRAFREGFQQSMGVFHNYLHDARDSSIYEEISRGFAGPLRNRPVLTIFGERNDPLKFQPRWKAIFPQARQVVVPSGNHFPMCDAPALVADEIRRLHHDGVAHQRRRAGPFT